MATGVVALFYALRAVLLYALDPGLYVEVSTHFGPTRFVLGAEPVLLAVGGVLLVVAGVTGWRAHLDRSDGSMRIAVPSLR
ncbi:hypothetical protein [Haloplanus halobius]|uniref:hypothetical protein n=1 Tax=Haloplanus halobius TaxID=2934938 RepID=UPI00200BD564|nr:hypothetical protein [Haloplanus sp. XH21]